MLFASSSGFQTWPACSFFFYIWHTHTYTLNTYLFSWFEFCQFCFCCFRQRWHRLCCWSWCFIVHIKEQAYPSFSIFTFSAFSGRFEHQTNGAIMVWFLLHNNLCIYSYDPFFFSLTTTTSDENDDDTNT